MSASCRRCKNGREEIHGFVSFFLSPTYTCIPNSYTFVLSYASRPAAPALAVKPINHMVIDWPLWEYLNLGLRARVAHQI